MTTSKTKPNPVALITGASNGIGLELAKIFAKNNYDLIITARSVKKLQALASKLEKHHPVRVHVLPQDLRQPRIAENLFRQVQDLNLEVDVLVNNAGFGSYGFFWELDLQKELDMLQVNMVALTHLTHLFLKGMVQRDSGKILNVSSITAFQPGPIMAIYYATKAFVLSFSSALSNELSGKGVTVSALCPGPTLTEFQKEAKSEKSKFFHSFFTMDASTVAQAGYNGLMKGKTVIIPGWINKILVQSNRFSPRSWVLKIVRELQGAGK